jgi:chitodextrinase
MPSARAQLAVLSAVVLLALGGTTDAGADPVIATAGDIACDPNDQYYNGGEGRPYDKCRQKKISDLLVGQGLAAVLPLGDIQYNAASLSNINTAYDPSWGRVKSITRPVIGNHESSGAGYWDYFNGRGVADGPAGPRGKGWYSFDIGAWHLIALNSNCSRVSCVAGSEQEQWLRADLAAHPNTCTLAFWHHPRFSSGHDGSNTFMQPMWQALYDYGVDVALTGHSHDYERFARLNASGAVDQARGIRQFVVGTGGAFFTGLGSRIMGSEVGQNHTFGVLKLTLHPTSYDWQFVPEAGRTWTDAGTEACHGTTPSPVDLQAPSMPAGLTATAASSNRVDLSWNPSTDNVGVTGYEIYRDDVLLTSTVGTGTTYGDTTVAADTSYTYKVRALDAAGNRSVFGAPATVQTPAPGPGPLIFAADADARVEEATPGAGFGTANLRVDAGSSPDVESYLRFPVSGLTGPVHSAKLRVYAFNNTANGPAVYATSSSWMETGLTWSNRPPPTSAARDDKGAIAANTWVEYDVTPFVTTNGMVSFRLAGTSSDGVDFYSREATSLQPELVVTAGSGPPPPQDTTPPSVPTGLAAVAASSSRVDLSWNASTDSVGVAGYEIHRDTAALASTAGIATTHSDLTAAADTTYSYTVRALDAAGNRSAFSAPVTVRTSAAGPGPVSIAPDADARVEEASPGTSFPTANLRVDAGSSPDVETYLRFPVSGLTGLVQSAKLRVYAFTNTANGPAVYATESGWVEPALTWSTKPDTTSTARDDKGAIATNTWVEFDVTPFVTGSGVVSFRLAGTSSDGVDFYSREAGSLRPELVITTG